jgi:hypothetical protein
MRLRPLALAMALGLSACYPAPSPLPSATPLGQAYPVGYYFGTVLERYWTSDSIPSPVAAGASLPDVELQFQGRHAERNAAIAVGALTVASVLVATANQPPPATPVIEYIVMLDRGPVVALSQLAYSSDPIIPPGGRAVVKIIRGFGRVDPAQTIPAAYQQQLASWPLIPPLVSVPPVDPARLIAPPLDTVVCTPAPNGSTPYCADLNSP